MTYRMNCSTCCPGSGMGSYYTYDTHQVFDGYGGHGMGSYYTYDTHQVFDGFGASVAFDAQQVWADAEEGGRVSQYQAAKAKLDCASGNFEAECNAVQKMINEANFKGNRAANAIRAGLRALGYTPGNDDSMWGGADKSAWSSFASDNNVPAGPGLVSKAGVFKMGEMLAGGATGKAGIGALGWTLLLLAAAAGTVALVSGRKKKGAPTPTGRAQVALRR